MELDRRSVAEQDDSARKDAAQISLRLDQEGRPAKSATRLDPLRLELAIAAKLQRASWLPGLRAVIGHEVAMKSRSELDYSNAWSARKRTMVNPRGFTASSSFLTFSWKA
jgi:hypothetical protein